MTSTKPKCLRKRLCDAISSSDAAGIESQLDKVFASYYVGTEESEEPSDSDDNDDNVTPLMMACDRCSSEALLYLRTQIKNASSHLGDDLQQSAKTMTMQHLVDAWGHPTETSSCGNSAAHHALSAGFFEGLDVLHYLWDCMEGESQNGSLHRYISLLSQTNENGDTPLMMACVSDHVDIVMLDAILERIFKLALRKDIDDNLDARVKETSQSLKDAFSKRNSEGCTALNLACGHGHIDTVRFLIRPQHIQVDLSGDLEVKILPDDNTKITQKEFKRNTSNTKVYTMESLVKVTYADVDFCEKSVDNLAAGLKYMKQKKQEDQIEEFHQQHKQASECLAMLECELERISSEIADELLLDSGTAEQSEPVNKSTISNEGPKLKGKTKKKKKKKPKRINTKQNDVPDNVDNTTVASHDAIDVNAVNVWASPKNETEKEAGLSSVDPSPFVTMPDGIIVSKSQKSDFSYPTEADTGTLDDTQRNNNTSGTKPKSLQSILQSTSIAPATDDDDIAAIMESLCLDPSMLLLSPHGMAMEMSPCQLDAIESILNHQLNATKEAQKIQSRLLDK